MSYTANPSNIWTQLAFAVAASGGLVFIQNDNITPTLDPSNLYYAQASSTLSGSLQYYQLTAAGGFRQGFLDLTSTPGSVTINKPAGRVKLLAGQTGITITSSYCFANSIVGITMEGSDATATRCYVTPAAGSFTVTFNAATTGNLQFSFHINNVF